MDKLIGSWFKRIPKADPKEKWRDKIKYDFRERGLWKCMLACLNVCFWVIKMNKGIEE